VVPAAIVAIVLLAVAVLTVWTCVDVLRGGPPLVPFGALAERVSQLQWNDPVVLTAGGVLALLGLVLLGCALLPGTPNVLSLADMGEQTGAGATRRSVRHAVARAAGGVDGVAGATAKVGTGRVRVSVTTPLRNTGDLLGRVRAAVGERLTTIALRRAPAIKVRIRRRRTT
jgi:hypothetical protein